MDEFDTETLITYVDMKNPASAWNEIRSSIPDHSESRPNYSKLSRIYLVLTLYDGDVQIVLNVYIRFKHQNHSLFVEANYYPLPPVKAQYLRLDENDFETNAQTMFFFAFSSLFTLPFSLAAAPWNLLRASHAKHRMRMRDSHFWDMIQKNLALDFGGHISIRQLGAGTHYGSYFERMDKEMNLKTIEQCLIDAIVDFLESHNVDTSDIRDRRAAILNQGIIVSGGGFQAGSVAVGSGATTVTHGANDVRASGDHAA